MGRNNWLGLITGISMIITCSLIAGLFLKYFFSKYRGKVKNAMGRKGGSGEGESIP